MPSLRRMPPASVTRFPAGLSQSHYAPLVLTSLDTLRRVIDGLFSFISLIYTGISYTDALPPMLTTAALYRSSLEWFETRFWKPISKGRIESFDPPSSLARLLRARVIHPFYDSFPARFELGRLLRRTIMHE